MNRYIKNRGSALASLAERFTNLDSRTPIAAQNIEKILKKLPINRPPLGMILHRQPEDPVAQAELLDDVVLCAPRFHETAFRELIDRLMMGTVHLLKTMSGGTIVPQRLHVVGLLPGKVVPGNVEPEGAAEGDVEQSAFLCKWPKSAARVRAPAGPRQIPIRRAAGRISRARKDPAPAGAEIPGRCRCRP